MINLNLKQIVNLIYFMILFYRGGMDDSRRTRMRMFYLQ